jgi:Na+-driven multidrug efflux pump
MDPLGNHGLWLAMLLFMAARGLWLGLVYLRIERGAGFVTGAFSADRTLTDRPAGT